MDCGANRYTVPGAQASAMDCLVLPGHGLASDGQVLSDGDISALSDPSSTDVVQCPMTHYGSGGAVASVCTPCPLYTISTTPGATEVSEFNGKSATSDTANSTTA